MLPFKDPLDHDFAMATPFDEIGVVLGIDEKIPGAIKKVLEGLQEDSDDAYEDEDFDDDDDDDDDLDSGFDEHGDDWDTDSDGEMDYDHDDHHNYDHPYRNELTRMRAIVARMQQLA